MANNKENMRQAMKELLGLVGFGPEGEGTEQATVEQPVQTTAPVEERPVVETVREQPKVEREPAVERVERVIPEQPKVVVQEPVKEPVKEEPVMMEDTVKKAPAPERRGFFSFGDPKPAHKEEPVAVEEEKPYVFAGETAGRPPFIRPGATIIAAGTSFFGDIRAEGDVEVLGKLKGNLEATGNVRITGKVLGDVKGEAVQLEGCSVQGNVTSTSTLTVDEAAMIVGDVLATDFESAGKVKGNIQIARAAVFFPTAILAGNVIAGTIVMNQGARIQGAIRIAEDPETNALFGEGLEI